jgi:hypothetical protein
LFKEKAVMGILSVTVTVQQSVIFEPSIEVAYTTAVPIPAPKIDPDELCTDTMFSLLLVQKTQGLSAFAGSTVALRSSYHLPGWIFTLFGETVTEVTYVIFLFSFIIHYICYDFKLKQLFCDE